MARPKSKSVKPRVNMTLDSKIVREAREVADSEGYGSLSELVETLLDAHNKTVNGDKKTVAEAKKENAVKKAAKAVKR